MAGQSGRLYRSRIATAATAVRDTRWVQQQFAGDTAACVRYLQDNWFADIGGFITLQKLFDIYDTIPEATWVEYNYNLRALELLHDRPELSDPASHVSVRAYVRTPSGGRRETRSKERERLLAELQRIDRRREKVVTRLRQLGVNVS